MGFKQPRVPEYQEGENVGKYLKSLVLFLKDFCQETWTASRQSAKEISNISYPVTSVNARTGDVTLGAADVGARANTWLPSKGDMKTIMRATWNGNTAPDDIPYGLSYVTANDLSEGHGFPVGYCTIVAFKDLVTRLFQMLIVKETGKLYIRSAVDGTTWGKWQAYTSQVDTLLAAYPVGAIYISTASSSPASLFGGTWEQIRDRFLLAAGGSYTAGATGGVASHQHMYGLQYGAYYGDLAMEKAASGAGGLLSYSTSNAVTITGGGSWNGSNSFTVNGGSSGSNKTVTADNYRMTANTSYVSNMPPYLAVYMWKRVS